MFILLMGQCYFCFSAAWLLPCCNIVLFSVLLRGKRTKDTLPPITAERRRWVRLTIASNRKANRAKPDLNRGRNKWFWRVFRPLKYPPAPHRLGFLSAWFALFTPRRGGSGFSIGDRRSACRIRAAALHLVAQQCAATLCCAWLFVL